MPSQSKKNWINSSVGQIVLGWTLHAHLIYMASLEKLNDDNYKSLGSTAMHNFKLSCSYLDIKRRHNIYNPTNKLHDALSF
jgi:hypothetical protein